MGVEFNILYWFQGLHNQVLDKIMVFITKLGSAGMFWIVLTVLMLIFCRKNKKAAWSSALALIFSYIVVNLVLKNLVARDRPCWIDTSVKMLVHVPKDYSFPSGHSSASFASATAIFFYYRKQGIAAYILAALIAISRMYLFVHFPTDVLGGTILGIAEGIAAVYLIELIYKKAKIGNLGNVKD
ncbi:MAG: phosphatase PAP2 family protein [Lachnospiraceae bacterium]|jgi:undecaprenyl-diphosphatase|nr:phosphatase PAP2 family protein [Lachnospiraceae bacterium]